ncbi:MAG: PA2169 family four-helix-bundle protein [Gemmatimonadaceae bacterium]|nr:PA2169 family four-helix-bundle protein [Gemmatimonadaceae bacterium]
MPLKNAEVISVLNDLIDTCEDGLHGFQTAADAVENPQAKALFASRLPNIQRGTSELKAEVRRLGGDPDKRGTVGGALHRGWINLKSAITGKSEEAIVMECERGEEHAAHVYEDALQKDLPIDTRAIVERQYRGVIENLNRVRALSTSGSARSEGVGAPAATRTSESETHPSA